MDDVSLLRAYADRGDEEAFAQLVRRHGNWLYSAARRQLGDGHLAEDVTQAVFLLLARRAGRLRRYAYLGGWLFIALGYCIRQTKQRQAATRRREQEAASMRPESVEEANWDEIAPLLERVVGRLGRADRDAVLLRFYEQKPLAEVGRLMGTSEEAAKKRVQRAVEKLRGMLERQGVTGTSAGLSAVLVGNVVEEVPGHVVGSVMAAIGGGGGGALAATGIARGAGRMLAFGKMKVALILIAAVSAAGIVVATGRSDAGLPGQVSPESARASLNIQVLQPDGAPAAGAEVYLPGKGANVLTLTDPITRLGQRGPTSKPTADVISDAQGRFSLTDEQRRAVLVVVHSQGVAEARWDDLAASPRVTLQAWGSVKGQLSPALRTGAGQKVWFFANHVGVDGFQLCYDVAAEVDADGKFAIPAVPPGYGTVGRVLKVARTVSGDHGVVLHVGPAETVQASIGGTGANVTGRVMPPAGATWRLTETYASVQLLRLPDDKQPELPAKLRADDGRLSADRWNGQLRQWLKTAEGQAWEEQYRAFMARYGTIIYVNGIRGDGVFELPEIPSGRYRMTIGVLTVDNGPSRGSGRALAQLRKEITVPAVAAIGEIVDLGDLLLFGADAEKPKQ